MYRSPATLAGGPEPSLQAVIVSHVYLVRECISKALDPDLGFRIIGDFASADDMLAAIPALEPDMILLDARIAGGAATAARLREARGAAQVIVFGLEESEDAIIDWAEAGIAGYVADTASMGDLPRLLRHIRRGGQLCSLRVVGGLLRRVARLGRRRTAPGAETVTKLTPRELVIQRCIGAGLTNKDIARQLNISVGTTKSHVHNILGKLNLTSRARVAARMMPAEPSLADLEAALRSFRSRAHDGF